ncbi:MAG: aminotransferase class I/II-fold pyridoxal phosphate-dependent enzyme [Actinobacteria bacterium]|nr:aminotransferase class I/II-fold pyridoxal phosphate-dependent enzyme [Actinomycetota bacterium]
MAPFEFETRLIHAGQDPDPATGAVVPPIHLATTFAQDAVGQHKGFEYARTGNPTRAVLESTMADLEGGTHAFAFASGMAAEDALIRTLPANGHIVIPTDAYGGTYRLFTRVHTALVVVAMDLSSLRQLPDETDMVWIESPTNPGLSVVDIAKVAEHAHAQDALVVVDNTFATPYLQRPLELGADVVVHSSTKYLGGHSDVVGGVVITDNDAVAEQLAFLQNATGAVPSPFDCYLVLRGLKTLALRMDRHQENAAAVAAFLAKHRDVERVLYPGSGGMVSFTLKDGEAAALRVAGRTTLFTLAESLGAVESLIEHPARMTHASAEGSSLAVDPALLRLSVGVEHIDDLIADLRQALE